MTYCTVLEILVLVHTIHTDIQHTHVYTYMMYVQHTCVRRGAHTHTRVTCVVLVLQVQ